MGRFCGKPLISALFILQTAVVLDEAFLLGRIHKFTYLCAGGTNHLRQGCLAHFQGIFRF
jgi:hypothetical protein